MATVTVVYSGKTHDDTLGLRRYIIYRRVIVARHGRRGG